MRLILSVFFERLLLFVFDKISQWLKDREKLKKAKDKIDAQIKKINDAKTLREKKDAFDNLD